MINRLGSSALRAPGSREEKAEFSPPLTEVIFGGKIGHFGPGGEEVTIAGSSSFWVKCGSSAFRELGRGSLEFRLLKNLLWDTLLTLKW